MACCKPLAARLCLSHQHQLVDISLAGIAVLFIALVAVGYHALKAALVTL
jgi:hypothetical protein